MILQIPGVLSASEIDAMRAELSRATFEDGTATAGPIAREVKRNLQLAQNSEAQRKCAPIVLEALRRNPVFFSAALPLRLHGPLFNRYEPGMTYGEHVDNALVGTVAPVRADLSATLFLSAPEEYDGGELIVHDSFGMHRVKLAAGATVLYPGNTVHEVTPVRKGTRLAAVLWVQSMVRDEAQRRILFELDLALGGLRQKVPTASELNTLTATYHNLLRLWSET